MIAPMGVAEGDRSALSYHRLYGSKMLAGFAVEASEVSSFSKVIALNGGVNLYRV